MLGEKLKALRMEKGITQEQLGEIFGVSAQAVSRWENDTADPDISLLPGLAIYFDVTVDALLGMDVIKKQESINQVHGEINRFMVNGKFEEAVAFIREKMKIYPGDLGLMMSLGETLARLSDDPACRTEAIRIGEEILQNGKVSMNGKGTTAANLLFLYVRDRNREKSARLIKSLPHIWESREMLAPEMEDGKEYEAALRLGMEKAIVLFYRRLQAMDTRKYGATPEYIQLGVDFKPPESMEIMLERIRDFLIPS
ncbi:MAG: helix-turn-helix domain-containing protein [Clostridiales bacterium]|nr:helix-turn-helix domain-containing protein [Clostridiales bacterium]